MPKGERTACTRPDHTDRRTRSDGATVCFTCRRIQERSRTERNAWLRAHRRLGLLLASLAIPGTPSLQQRRTETGL